MPRSQSDRFVFVILMLASVAILLFISRNGYVFLQESDFQNAMLANNDYAASRALEKGAFSGQRRKRQFLCDIAFRDNRSNTVAALMRLGFTPNDGQAPATIVSAAANCPNVVTMFLDRGAPIETRDTLGRTALMVIVRASRSDLARQLLDRGADVNARDSDGNTVLMSAGTVECAQLLLEQGADVNAVDERGATALAFRAREGNVRLVKFLMAKGAKLDSTRLRPELLAEALRVGRVNSTKPNALSPAQQSRVNELSVRMSPLCEAICSGRAEAIDLFLRRGVGLPDCNDALCVALSCGRADCVRTMLAHGARPDQSSPTWQLAVQVARTNAFVDSLELLRPYGVTADPTESDIESRNEDKQTRLHVALLKGNRMAAELLLRRHANVNVVDGHGRTPLQAAVENCPELVAPLLANHADPNVMSADGNTALKLVVLTGDSKMVRLLLAHGANANLRRPTFHTPMYFARRHGYSDVIALLEHAGGHEE